MSNDIYYDFQNLMPHLLIVDLFGECHAGFKYCFNSSTPDSGVGLSTEQIRALVDDAVQHFIQVEG